MPDTDPLIDFVSSVAGEAHLKIEENLGDGFVRLRVSEAERRQAKHDIRSFEDAVVELMRNSRDAHARRIWLATAREGETRTFVIIDDGVGVPEHLESAIFEPRVTSKLETMVTDKWGIHGRGMALFSVRENVVEARVAASGLNRGLSLSVVSDVTSLPERADQSTWPVVEPCEDGEGLRVARGPHNIVRRCVEFAVEHPEVAVCLGSPTEILATLFSRARETLAASELLLCDDPSRLPVWQRPAIAADAAELVDVAASIGLPVSERTAHRILGGELEPLETVLSMVTEDEKAPAAGEAAPDIYRDRRGLKLHHTDLDAFKRELEGAFDLLADRYYLHLKGEPKVIVGRDEIRVRFSVEKED